MSKARAHPEPSTLEAFALGRLDTVEMDRVEVHLGHCPACRQSVQLTPGDRLVVLLRREAPGGPSGVHGN